MDNQLLCLLKKINKDSIVAIVLYLLELDDVQYTAEWNIEYVR